MHHQPTAAAGGAAIIPPGECICWRPVTSLPAAFLIIPRHHTTTVKAATKNAHARQMARKRQTTRNIGAMRLGINACQCSTTLLLLLLLLLFSPESYDHPRMDYSRPAGRRGSSGCSCCFPREISWANIYEQTEF